MKTTNLEFTRQIPASPEEVYDVWINPVHPGGPWFGPNNEHQQSKVILDAKVDGLFYHRVTAAGHTYRHYGIFLELERGKVAKHTWVCEETSGRETTVTTTFTAKDGGTFVQLVHADVPDDDAGRGQASGWKWVLHALAEAVSKS